MPMKFKFDHTESGLRKTLKDYQELALRFIWTIGEQGATSGPIWGHVNEQLAKVNKSISRASIIFFLDAMVERGVLGYETITGKGGHFRRYKPELDERGYRKFILEQILESMMRDFPEETLEVLQEATKAMK